MAALAAAGGPGFDTFVVEVSGMSASVETASALYDPGPTAPFPGYADANMAWACCSGPCGNFGWYVELYPLIGAGARFHGNLLNPAAIQWAPGCLTPGTQYELWISSGSDLGSGTKTMSPSGDPFLYFPGWESVNRVRATTRSAPAVATTTFRNQAPNPASLTADPVRLAQPWTASVDVGTIGYLLTRIYAFSGPGATTLKGGTGRARRPERPPPAPTRRRSQRRLAGAGSQ